MAGQCVRRRDSGGSWLQTKSCPLLCWNGACPDPPPSLWARPAGPAGLQESRGLEGGGGTPSGVSFSPFVHSGPNRTGSGSRARKGLRLLTSHALRPVQWPPNRPTGGIPNCDPVPELPLPVSPNTEGSFPLCLLRRWMVARRDHRSARGLPQSFGHFKNLGTIIAYDGPGLVWAAPTMLGVAKNKKISKSVTITPPL